MSTHCLIGIKEKSGRVKAVYCHFDGYLKGSGYTGVGFKLFTFYNSEKSAKEIIALGDLSYLGRRLHPRDLTEHTFDNPQEGVTVAYHRDRGEVFNDIAFDSEEEFFKYGEPYLYLWKNGQWYVEDHFNESTLSEALMWSDEED